MDRDAAIQRMEALDVGRHLHNQLVEQGEHLAVPVHCTRVLSAVSHPQEGNVQCDPLARFVVHLWD